MTDAEKEAAKAKIEEGVKMYTRFVVRDVLNEVGTILLDAGAKAYAIEQNDENAVFAELVKKYENDANRPLLEEVAKLLDTCDSKHTAVITERDEKIKALMGLYT